MEGHGIDRQNSQIFVLDEGARTAQEEACFGVVNTLCGNATARTGTSVMSAKYLLDICMHFKKRFN